MDQKTSMSLIKISTLLFVLLLLAPTRTTIIGVNAYSTVIFGTDSNINLSLLTGKLATKAGIKASCIIPSGNEKGCQRLLYGKNDETNDDENVVQLISSGTEIGDALETTNSLVFICAEDGGSIIPSSKIKTLMDNAGSNLNKIICMSKMGSGGGMFGGGGGNVQEMEKYISEMAQSKNLDCTTIRAGVLKGGGPGKNGDLGLDKTFYNLIFDLGEATMTQAHDKFTLGASLSKGNSIEMPNMFVRMGTKTSFDAQPYDTNRVVFSAAAVAAMQYDAENNNKFLDFSVSSAKGETLPTPDEWNEMLDSMAK